MTISDIRITLRFEEKLKGFANVTFDDCFVVRGMKVVQGPKGYFVQMPNHKRLDGTHGDIAHPTTMEMRNRLEEAVLNAYTSRLKDAQQESSNRPLVTRELTNGETNIWPEQLRNSG